MLHKLPLINKASLSLFEGRCRLLPTPSVIYGQNPPLRHLPTEMTSADDAAAAAASCRPDGFVSFDSIRLSSRL